MISSLPLEHLAGGSLSCQQPKLDNAYLASYNDVIMRIGLVSDTHIPQAERALPDELAKAFQGVNLILHSGDIYIPSVLDELECIAPVLAASGDDDYGDTLKDRRVKARQILEIEGKLLWLVHIRPYYLTPWRKMFPGREYEPSAREGDQRPDIVVFGHEHATCVDEIDGVLCINSGSPTFLNYQCGLGTVGILEINSGKADVKICHL